MLPKTMNAQVLIGHGGPEMLQWRTDMPVPTPGPGQVLLRVAACGLNNTDINTRTGWYSKGATTGTTGDGADGAQDDDAGWGGAALSLPRTQGADIAGYVVALGDGAPQDLMGKRVMVDVWLRDWDDPQNAYKTGYVGSECDGGYAQYAVIGVNQVHPIECDLTDVELATFATSYVTAENMLDRAQVVEGDVVLITGASGGVGSALVQLANRRGARTIALCGESKAQHLRDLGADAVLPRAPEDLAAAVRSVIGEARVTVVADVVGGPAFPQLLDILARGGRYTCAGAIAGPLVDLDLRTFYLKDLTLTGATLVPVGTFARLVGYVARGEIKPIVAETFPLEQIAAAQAAFVKKAHVGNIVVIP